MSKKVLVIGATGTIGQVVVAELVAGGDSVRAFSRNARWAAQKLPVGVEVIEGDLTQAADLEPALVGVDAVILTHGGDADPDRIYVGGVQALIDAVGTSAIPVVLMSSINVEQVAPGPYAGLLNAKKHGEDLLRSSGLPYTIIRPGWFDAAGPHDNRVVLEQGDHIAQGGVRREHVAQTLVAAIDAATAKSRTVEVFSGPGEPIVDWESLFAATQPD